MIPLAIFLFMFAAPQCDEVELEDGTLIEGEVVDEGESIRIVKPEGSVTYPKTLVKRIHPKETKEEIYEERRRALKPHDLGGRLSLARWCRQNNLGPQMREEYRLVLEEDSDHEEARSALGHRKHQGAWMTEDHIKAAQGYVYHGGRWITSEERDLEAELIRQKEFEQEMIRKTQSCLAKMGSSDEAAVSAAQDELKKIDARYKGKALISGLASFHRVIRRYCAKELGAVSDPSAVKPLVQRILYDPDEETRTLSLQSLVALHASHAAPALVEGLSEESAVYRFRAIEAFSFFNGRQTAAPLVERLQEVTELLDMMKEYAFLLQTYVYTTRTLVLRDGRKIALPARIKIAPNLFDRETQECLMAEQALIVATLKVVTGENFGEDTGMWRRWLQDNALLEK